MSFFDVRSPTATRARVERPAWDGPPRGVLPGYSAQRAVLFRTDDALLWVHRFLAYPNGFEATLSLFVRGDAAQRVGEIPWEVHRHPGDGSLPDEFLRFGFLFSDDSKWTNLNWGYPAMGEEPSGPVVVGRGGHGGRDDWEIRYWMWPLPRRERSPSSPPGPSWASPNNGPRSTPARSGPGPKKPRRSGSREETRNPRQSFVSLLAGGESLPPKRSGGGR